MAPVVIVVVIIVAATAGDVAMKGWLVPVPPIAERAGFHGGELGLRTTCRRGAIARDQLLQLAPVEPDTTALVAAIDRDAVALNLDHRWGFASWTVHKLLLKRMCARRKCLDVAAWRARTIGPLMRDNVDPARRFVESEVCAQPCVNFDGFRCATRWLTGPGLPIRSRTAPRKKVACMAKPERVTLKSAAHDRWVCVSCRWTAKVPLVDSRSSQRPSYACPKCALRMQWTGTAFRPPRRDDDEAWQVAERLLAAGVRFRATRQRQRMPRTLAEVGPWLEQQRDDAWLGERTAAVSQAADGSWSCRCGRRALADRDHVRVWQDGAWQDGHLQLLGDGGKRLPQPVITLVGSPQRTLPLTATTRLRVPRRR
jgi:transposase-like protein